MIKDSGNRTVFDNGFQRDIQTGKGRFDLLPWRAIWQLAKHCEEGAAKYGEHNIDKGCPQHLLISSAIRHLVKYMLGWDDEPHLRAALWNVAWALEQTETHPELLDIPYKEPELKYEHYGEPMLNTISLEETDDGVKVNVCPASASYSDLMDTLFGPGHRDIAKYFFNDGAQPHDESKSES